MIGLESVFSKEQAELPAKIVDTNISLFQWPFRRLPLDESATLVKKFRTLGITEAWAGSFEGILHRDIAGVNQRLAKTCELYPELVPIGSVNPELPDWEDDLRRCVEQHKMPGIRLHPNYHGYTLADPKFDQLLKLATKAQVFVQIAAILEDTRTQHPMLQVPDVDLSPLPDLMRKNARAKVQILNYRPNQLFGKLAKTPGIFFDTSRVESTDGIAKLLKGGAGNRLMFGTHAPFLIPESALIHTFESDLDATELRSLLWKNAERIQNS